MLIFATNMNFSKSVAITSTLTKYATIEGETCLVEVFAGSERKSEAGYYGKEMFFCLHILWIFGIFENYMIYCRILDTLPYEMV